MLGEGGWEEGGDEELAGEETVFHMSRSDEHSYLFHKFLLETYSVTATHCRGDSDM